MGESTPLTVGEKVDRDGVCEAMAKMAELATALQRLPCGEWDYTFTSDPRWRICINGGAHDIWTLPDGPDVPRFYAYVEFNGRPSGLLNAAGGTMVGDLEEPLIAALEREIAHVQAA